MYPKRSSNATPAIPTVYRGIRMRSRLEAKWACMFDQLSWKWEYEPIDFNGWIPDFVITGCSHLIVVDIKPLFTLDAETPAKIERALGEDILEKYVPVILGAGVVETPNEIACGWIYDDWMGWNPAVLMNPTLVPGVYGLASGIEGNYADRITGTSAGDHYYSPLDEGEMRALWATATNAVQWKAPRQ